MTKKNHETKENPVKLRELKHIKMNETEQTAKKECNERFGFSSQSQQNKYQMKL